MLILLQTCILSVMSLVLNDVIVMASNVTEPLHVKNQHLSEVDSVLVGI